MSRLVAPHLTIPVLGPCSGGQDRFASPATVPPLALNSSPLTPAHLEQLQLPVPTWVPQASAERMNIIDAAVASKSHQMTPSPRTLSSPSAVPFLLSTPKLQPHITIGSKAPSLMIPALSGAAGSMASQTLTVDTTEVEAMATAVVSGTVGECGGSINSSIATAPTMLCSGNGIGFPVGVGNSSIQLQQAQMPAPMNASPQLTPTLASAVAAVRRSQTEARCSTENHESLVGALSNFGPPTEWWHDSIILGRLSALALKYFAGKTLRKPWNSWVACVNIARSKRAEHLKFRATIGLRKWHWHTLMSGKRFRRKIPLIRTIMKIPRLALAPAWERLRQAVFMQRNLERRLRLLHLVKQKMLNTMAQTHYCQNLLRLGIAGFWLAAQVPLFKQDGPPASSPSMSDGSMDIAIRLQCEPHSHVQQVVCRAWRRWCFATQLWLSSAEYRERETEAWLAGKCSTPRSIVTNAALQALGVDTFDNGSTQAESRVLMPLPNVSSPPSPWGNNAPRRPSPMQEASMALRPAQHQKDAFSGGMGEIDYVDSNNSKGDTNREDAGDDFAMHPDLGSDYWAMRCRIGPPRAVQPVNLRQRCWKWANTACIPPS